MFTVERSKPIIQLTQKCVVILIDLDIGDTIFYTKASLYKVQKNGMGGTNVKFVLVM